MEPFVVITFDLLTWDSDFNTQVVPLENGSGDTSPFLITKAALQELNKANDGNLTSDPCAEKLPEWSKTPESRKWSG
jgi:hypothetical protein